MMERNVSFPDFNVHRCPFTWTEEALDLLAFRCYPLDVNKTFVGLFILRMFVVGPTAVCGAT